MTKPIEREKRKAGRPCAENPLKPFRMRFTAAQIDQIGKRAVAEGIGAAEWVRHVVARALRKKR